MTEHLARVEFRRSGGFAGNLPALSVALDGDDAAALAPLVDLDALASTGTTAGGAPDAFRYELRVETADGERIELACGDTDLPAALRPLVRRLTELASRT